MANYSDFLVDLRRVVDLARLSPSSHNCQPWQVVCNPERSVDGGHILDLGLNRDRVLNGLNSLDDEMIISLGIFTFVLQASFNTLGYECQFNHTATGDVPHELLREADNKFVWVASVVISKQKDQNNTLFIALRDKLISRKCTRGVYYTSADDQVSISRMFSKSLKYSIDGFVTISHIGDSESLKSIAHLIEKYASLDFSHPKAWRETYDFIHCFQSKKCVDGFYLSSLIGTENVFLKLFYAIALHPIFVKYGTFLKIPQRMAHELSALVESTQNIVIFKVDKRAHSGSKESLLKAGMSIMAFWLAATQEGLSLHPLSVLLQHEQAKSELEKVLNTEDSIVFIARLGRCDAKVPDSPRRGKEEVLTLRCT